MAMTFNGRPATDGRIPSLIGLLFTAIGVGSSIHGIWSYANSGGSDGGLMALVGIPFAAFGVYALVQGVRRTVSPLAFHEASFTLVNEGHPLGSEAVAVLRLNPKKPMVLKGARLEIVTTEFARYSAGTRSRSYQDKVYEWKTEVLVPSTLDGPLEQEVRFEIPASIPPTWSGRYNRFFTTCELYVEIDNWPDLVIAQEVMVTAEVAA